MNKIKKEIMYSGEEAAALTQMEQMRHRKKEDKLKSDLVIENLQGSRSLIEIGCGWGQLLGRFKGKINRIAGLDESSSRLDELKKKLPWIEIYCGRADRIPLDDKCFDIVLTSQMLHEVFQFGRPGELGSTLNEIKRILKPGGRYFIIDHYDPGDDIVKVSMNTKIFNVFTEFLKKYKYRELNITMLPRRIISISKKDLQEFVTKIWSLGTAMEEMEMNETHTCFNKQLLEDILEKHGFKTATWRTFHPVSIELEQRGIKLVKGENWDRKFFLIASNE